MNPDNDLEAALRAARRTMESFVSSGPGTVEQRVELVAGLELMADAIQMLARRVTQMEHRERQRFA